MNRIWLAISLTAILGVVACGCDTAAPASYYSSRRALLGQPVPGYTPSNSIDQRLSGSASTPTNQNTATSSTNSPPPQTP
jgi:hypothetical protein